MYIREDIAKRLMIYVVAMWERRKRGLLKVHWKKSLERKAYERM